MELNYVSISIDAPPIRLAHTYPLRGRLPLNEFGHILSADIPDGFCYVTGGVTTFFSEPSDTPDAILGELTYQVQGGGSVTVVFTDEIVLHMPLEIYGSQVAGITVGVGFAEADDTYYAVFEKDGYTFLLTGEGVDRQEFESVLYFVVVGQGDGSSAPNY